MLLPVDVRQYGKFNENQSSCNSISYSNEMLLNNQFATQHSFVTFHRVQTMNGEIEMLI